MNIMKKITSFLVALLTFGFAYAQPTTNAPVPTKAAADVKSVFSDTYTSIATNYNPNWGQSGFASVNPTYNPTGSGSNFALAYPNFNYQGTELTSQSLANMEFLHVDVWTNANPANSILQVSPINNGSGAGETLVTINYTTGSWYSVDIPKSAFTGMTWDSVFQLKFAANGAGSTVPITIYLDNIYFWKTPVAAGSDATLSDLKVDGTTIAGFSANTITYTKGVPSGSSTVPQITLATTTDTGASRVITQATAVPGSATVVVTSQNTNVTKTYTVNYFFEGPATAAPTPPARAAANVISLFSEAYTNIAVSEWSATWDDSNITDVTIAGNATKKIDFGNFLGVVLTDYNNATAMTHFHMDYWIPSTTDLTGKVLNPKLSNHAAMSGETNALLLTNLPTVKGSWVSLDVALSTFTPQGSPASLNREKIKEFLITSNLGTVYVDNIYLHNNIVLANETFKTSSIKMYPNPTTNVLNIEALSIIDKVTVYNILGQEVISKTVGSSSMSLDVSDLHSGVYVINATIEGVTSTSKFVKK